MQEELGIEARWRSDGTAALIYPTGDTVELIKDHGLAFIEWEHFFPIRKRLAESHLKKRERQVHQVTAMDTSVVYCNICAVGTHTEGDEIGKTGSKKTWPRKRTSTPWLSPTR